MKKVVVRLSTSAGDGLRSPCKSILINLAKVIVPWEFLWDKLTPTTAENKSKALKVAVSLPGVQEVGLEGENKDQLVVKGNDELDPVILIKKLRKKVVASAEIVTVGPHKEDKEEKEEKVEKEDKDEKKDAVIYRYPCYCAPPMQLLEISEPSPSCSIL